LQSGVAPEQATPQAPQLAGSVVVVSHPGTPALHSRCAESHTQPAGPQTMLAAQAIPQPLQFCTVASVVSHPSSIEPLQSPKPGRQSPHAPPEQACCGAQALGQLPQCATSVAGSTSQPVATMPSQSSWPAGHSQEPCWQVAPAGH
jgi:hypothetical protein